MRIRDDRCWKKWVGWKAKDWGKQKLDELNL
jgi:hypothetical protein